ncbi:MAG: CDP-archaeol synthase [Candidatus Woesearchaeota archaeon]|nr:CDP-archaeol synthase [Candidatus Woesearchaeota archaeon]
MLDILGPLWFFLPAGIANMMPIFANKLFGPGRPIHTVFGAHKTWQGIISATLGGWAFFLLQRLFDVPFAIVDYASVSVFLGFGLAFFAIMGDLVESFMKRKIGIQPGKPWIPFDQLDYVVGGLLGSLLFVRLALVDYVVILVACFLAVFVVSRVGYMTGLRKEKY